MGMRGSSQGVGQAWPSFLRGEDSGEILQRLSQGDPLRLREGAARRLREIWFLLDPDRVFLRALGVCAEAVPGEDPPADLGEWARAKIDLAIEQLVHADREAEQAHPELLTDEDKDFPLLTQSLMLDPEMVRAASVAFNALDPLPRRAFFELLIEGRELAECIEKGPWDEEGLYDAIQTALATLGLDVLPEPEDDRERRKGKKAVKDLPEIAPEIRGLLEEIVADPRSSIRLAPRHALRSWFESGETLRAREVSGTKAERHLVEAHREALARVLREAAKIAYWKGSTIAPRPVGPDGKLYSPAREEPSWQRRVERKLGSFSGTLMGIELLRQCLEGIQPAQGHALALGSLSLVPCDLTRWHVAITVPSNRPGRAIALLDRLRSRVRPDSLKSCVLRSLSARMCAVGRLRDARAGYLAAIALDPGSPLDRACTFNLSCFLGEHETARVEVLELARLVDASDQRLAEMSGLLRRWASTRSERERRVARETSLEIANHVPDAAGILCETLAS